MMEQNKMLNILANLGDLETMLRNDVGGGISETGRILENLSNLENTLRSAGNVNNKKTTILKNLEDLENALRSDVRMRNNGFPSRTSTTYSLSTKRNVRGGESPRGTGSLPTTSSPELPFCRICLDTDEDSCGPLIAPCQCDGSLKHVHQYCLQRWIDMRQLPRCELCHSNFKNPMLAIPNGRASPVY